MGTNDQEHLRHLAAVCVGLAGEPAEFVVLGDADTVVLQRVRAPVMRDFDGIVTRAREDARRAGMRQSDVVAAIAAVRST